MLTVGLSGSQSGVNYQLRVGAVNTGAPVAGTGSAISFGLQTAAGTYTVVATSTSASACTSNMNGSAIVTLNPLPSAPGTITGTSPVCQGAANVQYTVPAITNATGYSWSVPAGASIVSGSNSNTIFVTFSTSAVSGNITVYGTNHVEMELLQHLLL